MITHAVCRTIQSSLPLGGVGGGFYLVKQDQLDTVGDDGGDVLDLCLCRDDGSRLYQLDDVFDALGRCLDVEVHVEVTRIEDAEVGIDALYRLVEEDTDGLILRDAQPDDCSRRLQSETAQVREADGSVLVDNGRLLRVLPDSLLK